MSDDKLPEPSQLPLTSDELKKHNSPWAGGLTKAPPADSYHDPLVPVPLQQTPFQEPYPFLKPAPKAGPHQDGDVLRIEPSILTKAAGSADEIHTAFTQPAAALEGPAQAAASAMGGWETAFALRAAHKQWETQAGTVAGWLAQIAESLRVGARDYTKTDHEIEEAFRGIKPRKSLLEGL
ncbi:type VII secretion target [Streptomyces sp. NPDC087917]|uniref:type VII secretion target n=1 Tax=unclassified Streptomyces TaxID=2593676 RepID=UPI00342A445D